MLFSRCMVFGSGVGLIALFAAVSAGASPVKNESELGLVIASGNTETTTLNIKEQLSHEWGRNTIRGNGSYLFSESANVESARAWKWALRYEREFSSIFSGYAGPSAEGDRFARILQRYHGDVGGKLFFFKEEKLNWFSELGYRHTRENLYGGIRNRFHYVRAYTEIAKQFNEGVSGKLWIEALPNLTESKDYQLNSEASVSAILSSVFSIKTAYLLRFDHQPAVGVAKKTDTVLTTALVAKF